MNQNSYMNNEEEIELKELIKVITDKWKQIAIATAVITGLVLLISVVAYFMKPPITFYQAFTTVELISAEEKAHQSVVFSELAKSELVAQRAIDLLKLTNQQAADLSANVIVDIEDGSNNILIGYKDQNPDTARQISNAIREETMKLSEASMSVAGLRVLESAVISDQTIEEKSPVNFVLNAVIAAILTIMASVFVIFFKRYLNDKVQLVEEIENNLGIKVIGVIPNKNTKL